MAQLKKNYAELEEKLVEMRSKAKSEVTSFLDDEIGTKLDKLSRQVARIESRLHTYHEVTHRKHFYTVILDHQMLSKSRFVYKF